MSNQPGNSRTKPTSSTTDAPTSRGETAAAAEIFDRATDYAHRVVAGTIVAGPFVRAACQRHLDDLQDAEARGFRWDLAKADRAWRFFEKVLCLNGGDFEGKPFLLSLWQAFVVGSIFGWMRIADGKRRFRTAYIEIAKGNGKSPLAAGVGLYMLTADGEARAEVYSAATKRDQALIMFADAVAMRDHSPKLKEILEPYGGAKTTALLYKKTGSSFKAIGSDKDSQSGPRPHCGLIDELHEHKSPAVIGMMRAGQKGRTQPLLLAITNSGVDRTSVCYSYRAMCEAMLTGTQANDEVFAFICGLDEDDDPIADESCWIKANPNLGVSMPIGAIRSQVLEAKGMPSKESEVRRLHFCQWVDAASPWIGGDLWMACEDEDVRPEEDWAGGDEEWVGALDLSGKRDLTALALARKNVDDSVDAFAEFWTPEDTLTERSRSDRVAYDVWAREGHLTATPGRSVNYAFVAQRLKELQPLFGLRRVAFDPYHITYLERELAEINCDIELIPHGQGFRKAAESGLWMPRSIELAEGLINTGKLCVAFNPCLRHCVASAVTEADALNNRIFTKRKKHAKGRIDGLVALVMAIGLLESEPADTGPSVYENRGLLTF